jgi:hypothetical protein
MEIKMKITKSILKQIIKEELSSVLKEEETRYLVRAYSPNPRKRGEAMIWQVYANSPDHAIELVKSNPRVDSTQPVEIAEPPAGLKEHEAPGELERIEEPEPKDMPEPETLLDKLEYLLRNWPACDEDPEGAACQYHKDLEEVVQQYGRKGCGCSAHEEPVQEQRSDNKL